MNQPDPKLHQTISFVKSGFRIAAGGFLIAQMYAFAGGAFIVAEILGIAEELV